MYPTIVIYLVQREQTNWHIPQTNEFVNFKGITQEGATAYTTTDGCTLAVNKYDGMANTDTGKIITPTNNCLNDAPKGIPVSFRLPLENQRRSISAIESNKGSGIITSVQRGSHA